MKNKILCSVGLLAFLSSTLFATISDGPHGRITSASTPESDNDETCVYCHTPHGANAAFIPAPLWNKPETDTVFTMYGANVGDVPGITIGGTQTDDAPSGASMACLSCHDGVSAMNSVINAPGSARYNPAGSYIGTNPANAANMDDIPNKAVGGRNGNLTDDHPLSIVYTPGRASLRETNTPLTNFYRAGVVGDLLRDGKVQCVSCHDPHGTPYNTYLRNGNTGSTLCFGCHDK